MSAGLTGCTVGPDYQPPNMSLPKAYAHASDPAFTTNSVDVRWWHHFHDPTLEALIHEAVENNRDLRVAAARLREAYALRHLQRMDTVPSGQVQAGFSRTARAADVMSGAARDAREGQLFDAGFDAFWELDLFGRIRRLVEAATAETAALEADRRALLLSVMAETARVYCELRGWQRQWEVARRNANVQAETLRIARAKFEAGRATELDVSRATAQYETTLALIPTLESSIQQSIHRLGVLTGQQPTAWESRLVTLVPLPVLPGKIPVGDPASLLLRRPDLQAAERALAAATARIGVATADLFPRVTFIGTLGWQAASLGELGAAASDAYSFGPRIQWAAPDLARVRDRIVAAGARADAQWAAYEQAVLQALEETENALHNLGRVRVQCEHLRMAAAAAHRAMLLAEQRYETGVAEYLTVLDAQRTYLSLEAQLAQAETRLLIAHVAVYKALGGGWELEEQPNSRSGLHSTRADSSPKVASSAATGH
ncbi:MAG: efflux transporter outer membrane subunit [Limisphaera sp.]|nr:efflux transporter outer membrane subunit [Limisphaera sp.]